jgi:hypothetical protein
MGFYYLDNLLSKGFRILGRVLPFPYKSQGNAGLSRYAILLLRTEMFRTVGKHNLRQLPHATERHFNEGLTAAWTYDRPDRAVHFE